MEEQVQHFSTPSYLPILADTARMSTRVSTVSSLRFPMIQHPLTKLADPETLSLTGCSTNRSGIKNTNSFTRRDRQMVEDGKSLHSAFRSQPSGVQSLRLEEAQTANSFTLPACIPGEVAVLLSPDRDTPKFPIFGKPLTCQHLVTVCCYNFKNNERVVLFSLSLFCCISAPQAAPAF